MVVPTGVAHDSLAPPGSGHHWTPDKDWVHRHWIPFDVRSLQRELERPGHSPARLRGDCCWQAWQEHSGAYVAELRYAREEEQPAADAQRCRVCVTHL